MVPAARPLLEASDLITTSPPRPHSLLIRVSTVLLAVLVVVMPSITTGERSAFSVAGIEMNARFLLYAAAAAGAAGFGLATFLALHGKTGLRELRLPALFLTWMTISTVIADQHAQEWLPTLLR